MIPQDAAAQINFGFSNATQPQQQDNTIQTVGENYNNTYDPITKKGSWTSHPDYLLDYHDWQNKPVYIPYEIDNSTNFVTFSTSHNSITLYRDTCTVKLYNGGKIQYDSVPLTTVSFDLQKAQNSTDNWYDSQVNSQPCIISYTATSSQVTFDMIQSIPNSVNKDIRFIFNLGGNPEAILSVTNNNQTDTETKYGFAVTLNNIPAVNVANQTLTTQNTTQTIEYTNLQNDLINVNSTTTELKFDTQNSINHYLWAAKVEPSQNNLNLILDYKNAPNALPPNQTLSIDPTWTSGIASASYAVETHNSLTTCASDSSASINTGSEQIVTPPSGSTTYGCQEFPAKWNISGIPQNIVVNTVTLQFDVSLVTNGKNCDFTQYTTDPAGQTAAQIVTALAGNTRYVSNTATCASVGTAKQISLGSTAATDFQNKITGGWFAVGVTFNDFNKDCSGCTNEDDLINDYVIVTYTWNPPAPITTLSCNDNAINSVACSWSAPTSTDSIVGYYLTKNTTLNAPLYTSNLIGYYKLDYNDPQYGIVDSSSTKANGTLTGSMPFLTGKVGYDGNFTGSNYIVMGSGSTFNFERTQPLTFTMWIKTTATGGYCLINKGGAVGEGANWSLCLGVITAGKLTFEENHDNTGTNYLRVTGSQSFNDGNWHFIAVTYDGSSNANNVKFYKDGILDSSPTINANALSASILENYAPALGTRSQDLAGRLIAQLDEVRIYNSVLSLSQLNQIQNYQLISSTSYTDTTSIYPFTYNYNVYGLSDKGQVQQVLGNTVQIAPYNVIDPPFKANATLSSDSQGFYENLVWTKPKIANSICGSLCAVNGYQVQQYNTTSHSWQTLVTNQSATTYKDRNIMQNQTQQIRLLTSNHGGWSAWTFPLNTTTYPQEVSHWFLQNNLIDTRNLNNGTLTGNWNFTSNGINGNSQVLDGSTFDDFGNPSSLGFTASTPFTLATWITFSNSAQQAVIGKHATTGSGGAGYDLYTYSDGKIYFEICDGSQYQINTGVINNGVRHFVVGTYDGSGNSNGAKLYVDGILVATGSSHSIGTITNSADFRIGADGSGNNKLTANISDSRVFSSALTAQQVTNLYNSAISSRQNYAGTLSIINSVVGNVMGINGTLTTTTGFPQTANLTNYKLVNASNSNAVLQTHTTNTHVPVTLTIPEMWNVTSITNPYNYYENVTVQASQGNVIIKSNIQAIKGLFNPAYYNVANATTPHWFGQAYRTNNGNNIVLKLNGNPITFTTTCTMQSSVTPNDTVSINYNNVGFVNGNYSNFPARNTVYGFCTDAPVKVFNFTLYGNQTGSAGFLVYGDVLGSTSFFGVSWVFLFVLLAASTVTAKDSVFGIIMTVALIGILAAAGMINNIPTLIWSGIILLAAIGVMMGKRAFFD
ncbi:MAG: hypothetical protein KGJ07_00610 [Patescibacteria group bacterium]|nr:hypothetical protein [Patescibacteria group bacterium]